MENQIAYPVVVHPAGNWVPVTPDTLPEVEGEYAVYGNCTGDGLRLDIAYFDGQTGLFSKLNQPHFWCFIMPPGSPDLRAALSAPTTGEASQSQQWVSVKDRLPEPRQRVLLMLTTAMVEDWHEAVQVGYLVMHESGTYHWSAAESICGKGVSHWAPLPAKN